MRSAGVELLARVVEKNILIGQVASPPFQVVDKMLPHARLRRAHQHLPTALQGRQSRYQTTERRFQRRLVRLVLIQDPAAPCKVFRLVMIKPDQIAPRSIYLLNSVLELPTLGEIQYH